MIQVNLITEKELESRYNSLPKKLRSVLDDSSVFDLIDQIAVKNHIADEEKKEIITQLTALTFLGFSHIDDFARELDYYLSLNNYKFSKAFAEEITNKIFAPVRSEIEKNYRPIAPSPTKSIETQAGQAAIKMTPTPASASRGPVPLGQLEAKDAFARPTTPPRFSPQPTSQPKPAFVPPSPFQKTTPTPTPSASVPMSKIPPLDLSQKHATAIGATSPAQAPQITKTPPIAQTIKPVEIKREVPFQKKDEFGFGAEIQKLERAGNELVEVLKEREEQKEKVEIKTPPPKTAPAQPFPLRQGPVMIHQESMPEPIRPSTDFKLDFPAAKPATNFSGKGEVPKMAKIEIGGTTEKQLEGVAKSSVIQPPKVVHYNAFQTPMDKPTNSPTQPPSLVSQPPMPDKKPLSQSPFVQTGKGLGDMRLESSMDSKVVSGGGQENLQPKKVKMVDFVDENAPIQEQKKGWFAKIFGKKDTKIKEVPLSSPVPIQPTRVPITPPPIPPAVPKPATPVPPMNIQNVKNFAGTPKEQIMPKTQDIKPQGGQFKDTDVIDLNTFEIKK